MTAAQPAVIHFIYSFALSHSVTQFLRLPVPERPGRPQSPVKKRHQDLAKAEAACFSDLMSNWYSSLPSLGVAAAPSHIALDKLTSLTKRADTLYNDEVKTFQASSAGKKPSSEASFLAKIVHSGTLSDRLSALTLLVQSNPLQNAKALETLKSMAERGKGKGGREESLKALRCVVDWWAGGGVPDRKLK